MKYNPFTARRKWPFLLIIASSSIFGTCRKNQPLPEFYFRCKVNGNDYRPNNCANCNTCDLLGDTTFIIGANRDYEAISIGIKDNDGINPVITILNHLDLNNKGGGLYKNTTLTTDVFRTDSIHTGQLNIATLDRPNKIISGTFHFKAFNKYRNDSVSITEGKFRLKYNDH